MLRILKPAELYMLLNRIKEKAKEHYPFALAVRRHLHQNPELSFKEFNTADYIRDELTAMGLEYQVMAETGTVAHIFGRNPQSRVMALRADIDALPIQEENNVPYRSCHDGVMHACGHDAHTACLLGAARILTDLKDEFEGTIKLIFQPGEEKNPGGASLMIRDGALENPRPQAIAGLHVHTPLPVGEFSFRGGTSMASADELYINIYSPGGHAAIPHKTADPILAAAHMVTSLQQIVSRNIDPMEPVVLSICSIQGGHATNVIPNEVKMMGTLRCMNETVRHEIHQIIRRQVEHLAAAMNVRAELHIDIGYPMVYNNPELYLRARALAEAYAGKENVGETEKRMGAEDFGHYAQEIPACFFRLGARDPQSAIVKEGHTSTFDIDERCLEYGIGMMAWLGAATDINGLR